MPENNTPTNDEANNPDSPTGADAPDVLDTSGKGGPFIPRGPITAPDPPDGDGGGGGGGGSGGTGGGGGGVDPQPPPATEEFVVEIELAPGVENIDHLLSGINALDAPGGGLEATGGGGADESDVARVARTHGLIRAQPIFTPDDAERHRTRIATLREGSLESVTAGGSAEELEPLQRLTRYVSLRFPAGTSAAAVLAELRALPQVRYASVVPRAAPPAIPNDPLIGNEDLPVDVAEGQFQPQWYLHRTRVPQAWQLGLGEDVVIVDVDFGCNISHREFIDAIEHTHNSYDETDNVSCGDEVGHGTAVLGIAGARADGQRIAGYAPKAKLWAIQGNFGCNPRVSDTPWTAAINHAVDTDAGPRRKVILIELETKPKGGNYEQVQSIRDAISVAILHQFVVVVTAGNGNRPASLNDDGVPFAPTGSILVGATVADGAKNIRAGFSNFGPEVVVSAPGDELHDVTCGPDGNNSYRNKFGGTSGAAAKVAGTVALMLSVNPNLSHAEVREILHTTGSEIITEANKPVGRFLDAGRAVQEAHNRLNH